MLQFSFERFLLLKIKLQETKHKSKSMVENPRITISFPLFTFYLTEASGKLKISSLKISIVEIVF